MKVFENKMQANVLYTEFRKAFDEVINKFSLMGLNDSAVKWLNSSLSQRTQQVKCIQ